MVFRGAFFLFFLFSILVVAYSPLIEAAEVDHFSHAAGVVSDLRDSREVLNQEVNRRLQRAVTVANRLTQAIYFRKHPKTGHYALPVHRRDPCNPAQVYRVMEDYFVQFLIGELEAYAEKSEVLERASVPFVTSVYRDFLYEEAPSLAGSERLASILNIGGLAVGTDKLGHFFSEGWSYFKRGHFDAWSPDQLLFFGEMTESLHFGAMTTGVYSYADLAANYNGYLFWVSLLGHRSHPFVKDQSLNPYLSCDGERWHVVRAFDWADYVDLAWDESINCVQFRNERLYEKFSTHASSGARDAFCRARQDPDLLKKYRGVASHLLSPGWQVLPEHQQSYGLLQRYWAERFAGQSKPWLERRYRWLFGKLLVWRDRYDILVD